MCITDDRDLLSCEICAERYQKHLLYINYNDICYFTLCSCNIEAVRLSLRFSVGCNAFRFIAVVHVSLTYIIIILTCYKCFHYSIGQSLVLEVISKAFLYAV